MASQRPGVLEASANLEDAVLSLARAPAAVREDEGARWNLVNVYQQAGASAGTTTLERCIRIMKDSNEELSSKMAALWILDSLMLEQESLLAKAVVAQLKFFTGVAKRNKDKERRKRRPSGFDPDVTDEDVAQFVNAVCEFIDKWGRFFEQDASGEFSAISQARWDLSNRDRVRLPQPDAYQFLSPVAGGAATGGAATSGAGQQGGGFPAGMATGGPQQELDESRLASLAESKRRAMRNHGPEAQETVEAHSAFEAELNKWQRAAQEAVDREDMEGFERFSEVAVRFAEIGENEAQPPPPAPAFAMDAPPWTPPTQTSTRDQSALPGFATDLGAPGPTEPPQQQAVPDPWAAPWSNPAPPVENEVNAQLQRELDQCRRDLQEARQQAAAAFSGHNAAGDGGGEVVNDLRQRVFSAQQRGTQLEEENTHLHRQLEQCRAELLEARAAKPTERNGGGADARQQERNARMEESAREREVSRSLRELNEQLQREMNQCRRELFEAHHQVKKLQDKLAEREEVISETRERLFTVQERTTRLEDEMKNQSEVQKSLQGRLQTARADRVLTDLEIRQLRHTISAGAGAPGAGTLQQQQQQQGFERPRGGGNRPYGSSMLGMSQTSLVPPPTVNQSDELAGSALSTAARPLNEDATPSLSSRLSSRRRLQTDSYQERKLVLPCSPPEVWRRTPRIARPPGAIVSQTPPAHRSSLERTNGNFQKLMANSRGPLYEDQNILMEMVVLPFRKGELGRPCIDFEIGILNRSSQSVHEVRLRTADSMRGSSCELQMEASAEANGGGMLRQQQHVRFRGQLQVFGPFDMVPQVDFSYLLPDNLGLQARLRLPLAITRLMSPAQQEDTSLVELWNSPGFGHTEVSVVCTVRGSLLNSSGPFAVWKGMELGGTFRCYPSITDDNGRGVLLAASYPERSGASLDVLVRGELGAPNQFERKNGSSFLGEETACRVAVRSTSHPVNQAVAQVLLDMLCDVPESAAAA